MSMIAPNLYFGTGLSAEKDATAFSKLLEVCLQNGINCFDTAPSYNMEKILGKALIEKSNEKKSFGKNIRVQTKIDAWQMIDGNILGHIRFALEQMKLESFDAVLIHWPLPEYLDETWEELRQAKHLGLTRRIGICNVRIRQMKHVLLYDEIPDVIQIERHPLFNNNAVVDTCLENGIEIQAYSPLCKMDKRLLESPVLQSMSKEYGKSIGQIILRWHFDSCVSPIFTSKKRYRIEEYSTINSFSLDKSDVRAINDLNVDYKLYLESWACPGF